MSTNSNNLEKLKERLLVTQGNCKIYLEYLQKIYSKAINVTQECKSSFLTRLDGNLFKLKGTHEKLRKQLDDTGILVQQVQQKHQLLLNNMQTSLQKMTVTRENLLSILEILKKIPVSSKLLQSSSFPNDIPGTNVMNNVFSLPTSSTAETSTTFPPSNVLQNAIKMDSSLAGKTLYDFVNVESLGNVLQQSEHEIAELKKLFENSLSPLLEKLLEDYKGTTNNVSKLTSYLQLTPPSITSVNIDTVESLLIPIPKNKTTGKSIEDKKKEEKKNIDLFNAEEIKKIGEIVLMTASVHDKIQFILSNQSMLLTLLPSSSSSTGPSSPGTSAVIPTLLGGDSPTKGNVLAYPLSPSSSSMLTTSSLHQVDGTEEYEKQFQSAKKYEEKVIRWFDRIQENCNKVEKQYKQLGTYNQLAQICQSSLEEITLLIPSKMEQIDSIDGFFQDQTQKSRILFDETMSDLTEWYQFFVKAYDALLLEFDRRMSEKLKMERFVQEVQQRLRDGYQEELEKRKKFHQEFGSYLPSSLYANIAELPVIYQVIPVREEDNANFEILGNMNNDKQQQQNKQQESMFMMDDTHQNSSKDPTI